MSRDSEKKTDGIKVLKNNADADFRERYARLAKEIERLGASLIVFELTEEAAEAFLHVPSPVVLPGEIVGPFVQNQNLTSEMIGIGLLRTIELARPHGPSKLLADSLVSCAYNLHGVETWLNVLPMIIEAVQIYDQLEETRDHARAYIALAVALLDSGLKYDVMAACERAKVVLQGTEFHIELAAVDYYQGVVCRQRGEHVEAERFLDDCYNRLEAIKFVGDWKDRVRLERLRNYIDSGDDDKAMQELNAWIGTMNLSYPLDEHITEYSPFFMRARLHKKAEKTEESLADFMTAARIACQERRSYQSQLFRTSHNISTELVFREGITAAVEAKRSDLAFFFLETAKTEGGAIGFATRSQSWMGEADNAVHEAVSESQEWVKTSTVELTRAAVSAVANQDEEQILECQRHAERLLGSAGFAFVDPFKKRARPGANETLIMELQKSLPTNSLLLEYGATEDKLCVVALTPDTLSVRVMAADPWDIKFLKRSFLLECRNQLPCYALEEISNALLSDVRKEINDNERIAIVADELAAGIPFHALNFGGQPLGHNRDVTYLPSASSLVVPGRQRRQPTVTSSSLCVSMTVAKASYVELPVLSGVSSERAAFSRHLGKVIVFENEQATAERLLNLPEETEILHLACHARFEPDAPLLSCVFLADRPVFAFEVILARLELELAVLSACQTATSRVYPGGESQGLASAFAAAGTRNVLGSLWPMADAAGVLFVEEFFRQCTVNGLSFEESTSLARANVHSAPNMSHPFFWAPFVIQCLPSGTHRT